MLVLRTLDEVFDAARLDAWQATGAEDDPEYRRWVESAAGEAGGWFYPKAWDTQ